MIIKVVKGAGEGLTLLSAFDAALKDAGVYNYNLIVLSSVIPPGSEVVKTDRFETPDTEWGHKLYCVKAQESSDEAGKFIGAGIGWYQLEDGRGVFVEHHLTNISKEGVEQELQSKIRSSLSDLCKFRGIAHDENRVGYQISTTQVKSLPACVLVLAVYKSEGWT